MSLEKIKNGKFYSLVGMILITGFIQVTTLMKSSVVAGVFGTSTEIDAYNFANSIVTFIFGFISAGISTVIIPSYVKKRDRKIVDSFITLLYGVIGLVILFTIIFRKYIIIIAGNKNAEFVQIAGFVLFVLLIFNYLYSVADITVAHFQCIDRYNTPKIINLFAQVCVIVVLIIVKQPSIRMYTFIIAGGLAFNFAFDLLFALKSGWRYKPTFAFLNSETKKLVFLFLPTVLSSGVYKLSLMVDSIIAAQLETGKITILSYSSQISSMVNTLFVGNLLIFCYPKIVRRIKDQDSQKIFWEQTDLFHLIVCLIIAGFACVGKEGIALLFQHGKFDETATRMVFIGTMIYILGQQTNIIRDMIYRYFYALGNTKIATYNSVLVSVVNISISIILVRFIGFYGIIIGTICASFVSLIGILVQFSRKVGFDSKVFCIIKPFLLNILIAAITIICVYVTKRIVVLNNNIISIILFGAETVCIYVAITLVMKRRVVQVLKKL